MTPFITKHVTVNSIELPPCVKRQLLWSKNIKYVS